MDEFSRRSPRNSQALPLSVKALDTRWSASALLGRRTVHHPAKCTSLKTLVPVLFGQILHCLTWLKQLITLYVFRIAAIKMFGNHAANISDSHQRIEW